MQMDLMRLLGMSCTFFCIYDFSPVKFAVKFTIDRGAFSSVAEWKDRPLQTTFMSLFEL